MDCPEGVEMGKGGGCRCGSQTDPLLRWKSLRLSRADADGGVERARSGHDPGKLPRTGAKAGGRAARRTECRSRGGRRRRGSARAGRLLTQAVAFLDCRQ
eukprot:ctg_6963.g671